MAKHSTALVPIDTWAFGSPDVQAIGRSVDIGLMAEALLYFERVLLHVTTQSQFADLLRWVQRSGDFELFLSLVRDGVITMYDYSFHTGPISKDGVYSLWNIQDAVQAAYGTFHRRFLYHREVEDAVPNSRRRKALYAAFRDRVIEAKADDFGPAIENARNDFYDSRRNAVIVQAFVDELYRFRKLGRPPEIKAHITPRADGLGQDVTWNVSYDKLQELAGATVPFGNHTPLAAAGVCNRLLWSAATRQCDLYLGPPMGYLVGDKLYETVRTPARIDQVLVELKTRVEFPDVRAVVNDGALTLTEIVKLRAQAARFRMWLQSEADRDRDAIVAYHNEVAKESGLTRAARKSVAAFGVVGGGALGGAIGAAAAGPIGGAVGGAAGAGLTYLTDLGAKLGADWHPVVFAEWLQDRIAKYVQGK